MTSGRLFLPVLLMVSLSACFSSKKAAPVIVVPPTPAPPPAVVPVAQDPPKMATPKTITTPDTIPPPVNVPGPAPGEGADKAASKPPAQRRRTRKPVAAPPPDPTPAPPEPAVAEIPKLQEILPADRRKQYEDEFSQGIARAGDALKLASTRKLNSGQKEMAARVRTFLAQAAATHNQDLSTALQLARRADLIGQELMKSLR